MNLMKACSIEWITIPAPDLQVAEQFYSEVFGFEVSEFSSGYMVFKAGNLSGGLDQNLAVSSGGIGFSITVADMQRTLEALIRHGGQLVKEPYSLGDGAGYCAAITDPNGNRIEIYCASGSN